jgi:hypothetical protein
MLLLCPHLDTKILSDKVTSSQNEAQRVLKLKPAFKELARLLLNNNIKFDETVDLLKDAFIDSARDMNEQTTNKSAISLKTGIDRRQISWTNEAPSEDELPRKRHDPMLLILSELRKVKDQEQHIIKKKGAGTTLFSIINRHKGRLTAPTIINELVHLGCLQPINKKEYKITATNIRVQQSDARKYIYAGNQIYRLISTLRKNIEFPDQSVLDWSVESTQISPANKQRFIADAKEIRDHIRSDLMAFVDSYESEVEPGTYSPISFSVFMHNQED